MFSCFNNLVRLLQKYYVQLFQQPRQADAKKFCLVVLATSSDWYKMLCPVVLATLSEYCKNFMLSCFNNLVRLIQKCYVESYKSNLMLLINLIYMLLI